MPKVCSACSKEKPLEEFPKNSRGKFGRGQKCNSCSAMFASEYRKLHPFRVKAAKFNTSEEVIEELLSKGVCDICSKKPTCRQHSIDHDHKTGKIRGLLCDTCNKGLGQFSDNPALLIKAAKYLERNTHEISKDSTDCHWDVCSTGNCCQR